MAGSYPILEFDPDPTAIIDPAMELKGESAPPCGVLCFFGEVVRKVSAEKNATTIMEMRWESGDYPVFEMDHQGRKVAFLHIGVGAPLAVGHLEVMIALGCRKIVACGGAGVLDRTIPPAHLVVPTSAVRDEGTSYHYLEPSREVVPDARAVRAIEATLESHHVPYHSGKTWTTDAPYRETKGKVLRRRKEDCLTVEMEAAALFSVARFRGIQLGQILYGGDDVSGETWDTRDWKSRAPVREKLFWLAVEACLGIEDEENR